MLRNRPGPAPGTADNASGRAPRARGRRPELLEQRLVALGHRRRRRPALDEAAPGLTHPAPAVGVVDEARARAAWKASGSSGATAMPAPGPLDGAGDLGAGVDAGQHRPAGGEDRVQLRRHAGLGQAPLEQARCARRRRPAPRAAAPRGCIGGEADVGQAGGGPLDVGQRRAAAVDDDDDVVAAGVVQAPGRLDEQVEALAEADVAGVEHDGLVGADAELAAVGVVALGRPDPLGVDEVRDDPHLAGVAPAVAAELGDDVVAQVVGQDGDGVGGLVADPLEPATRRR